MRQTLSVLHTNDFHDKLSETQAQFIHNEKERLGPDCLLLDAGDAVSAGNIGVRLGGEPILERMSRAGYDAMTMGNREFHIADGILRHKIGEARFPVLCANIRRRDARQDLAPLVPSWTKTLPNGLRATVFGLTVPMVTERMAARHVSAFVFDDPIETSRRMIQELRKQSDVLIALSHIGLREDERLARSCPELDLIIGGHSHAVLTEAQRDHGVPIVQAGWFGHYLGIVNMEVEGESVKVGASSLTDLRTVRNAGEMRVS